MELHPDMPVDAADGPCGALSDVVVDPVRGTVTHLVVRRPHGTHPHSHLVPAEAATAAEDRLRLSWTRAEVDAAEPVDETHFVELGSWPRPTDRWDIGVVRALSWPYFRAIGHLTEMPGPDDTDTLVEYDRIPPGTAEIRRSSEVFTRDHELVGHVEGLVVDAEHRLTHVVLQHGHLWGRREVTIPVTGVESVTTDAVYLRLTRDDVEALTPARFERHP